MTIGSGSTVVASADQVSNTVEGEAVVLELRRGTYFGLDAIGTRIWLLIQEPRTVEDLCGAIEGEYDVEPERCRADVTALLEQLAAAGLVDVDP
jgi:hypothetical protein